MNKQEVLEKLSSIPFDSENGFWENLYEMAGNHARDWLSRSVNGKSARTQVVATEISDIRAAEQEAIALERTIEAKRTRLLPLREREVQGKPVRKIILARLNKAGKEDGMSRGELAETLNIKKEHASRTLAELVNEGLAIQKGKLRFSRYYITTKGAAHIEALKSKYLEKKANKTQTA